MSVDLNLPQFQQNKDILTPLIKQHITEKLNFTEVIKNTIELYPPLLGGGELCCRYEVAEKTFNEREWIVRLLRAFAGFYGVYLHANSQFKANETHYPYCIVGHIESVNNFYNAVSQLQDFIKKEIKKHFSALRKSLVKLVQIDISEIPQSQISINKTVNLLLDCWGTYIFNTTNHIIYKPQCLFDKRDQLKRDIQFRNLAHQNKIQVRLNDAYAERYGLIKCWHGFYQDCTETYLELTQEYIKNNSFFYTLEQIQQTQKQIQNYIISHPIKVERPFKGRFKKVPETTNVKSVEIIPNSQLF